MPGADTSFAFSRDGQLFIRRLSRRRFDVYICTDSRYAYLLLAISAGVITFSPRFAPDAFAASFSRFTDAATYRAEATIRSFATS